MEELTDLLSFVSKSEAEIIAKRLFSKFDSLKNILSADIYELEQATGSSKTAIMLKLCAHLWSRSITDSFSFGAKHSMEQIREYFRGLFFGLSDERVYMMCIDGADRIISCDLVGEGTVNSAGVIPRHMLETALRGKATGVIIAHNHPHGDASASNEDLNMTHMLYNLFYSSGIRLIEHYIASVDECEGIISKYKESFI